MSFNAYCMKCGGEVEFPPPRCFQCGWEPTQEQYGSNIKRSLHRMVAPIQRSRIIGWIVATSSLLLNVVLIIVLLVS